MKKCKNCQSDISKYGKVFCSRSCAVTFNNKEHPKRKLEGKCKICNEQISSSRIYCSSCIKSARSKKLVNGQEFKKCKICKENKHYTSFYGNRDKSFSYCKLCESKRVKNRQREFKQKCVDYLGGKCSNCGYDKCLSALDFHHTDPSNKKFGIASYSKARNCWKINSSEIMSELDKCILLCSNCHREKHDSLNTEYQNRTDKF